MINILHTGLSEDQVDKLSGEKEFQLREITSLENELSSLDKTDLIIFGPGTSGLYQKMQEVHRKDKDISLLAVTEVENHDKIKGGLKFLPFLGHNYLCIDENNPKIIDLAKDHSRRTQQRRSFRDIQEQSSRNMPAVTLSFHPAPNYLGAFIEQAPIGMFLLNKQQHIVALNENSKKIFELTEENAVRKKFSGLFPEKEQPKIKSLLEDQNEKKLLKYHGYCLEVSASQIIEENIEYYIVILKDVTMRIEMEQQLKEKLREVKHINKELEQVAYILSHDLKNPMVPLKSYCQLACETTDPAKKDEYLEKIESSADHLLQQTEGLEALIDLERKSDNKAEKIDLNTFLNEIIADFEEQLQEINGHIRLDLKVQKINFIKPYLSSIASNFISNAIKYARDDHPLELVISTRQRNEMVELKFADNGIGIDLKKHRDEIFKPYTRFSDKAAGRGIGLSVVKKIVQKNDGKIEIESQPGAGTTFTCLLNEHPS